MKNLYFRISIVFLFLLGSLSVFIEYGQATGDPYEDVYKDDYLKSVFLRKMANASLPSDPAFTEFPNNPEPSPQPIGASYTTSTGADLANLYQTIYGKIRKRGLTK